MPIDKVEEKYAVISGSLAVLDESKTKMCIGVRRGTHNFEALVERKHLGEFERVSVRTPNIENLLTFSIWGHRDEIVEVENNG